MPADQSTPADTLRTAAQLMREREQDPTLRAVAGWLWAVAIDEEYEPETAPRIKERIAALAVARAYLGTTAQVAA